MAERRMFAKTIIDSDEFLDMPLSTQSLYFHFAMRADDEGFVNNPKKIMRVIQANNNDFDILIAKSYVLSFDGSGVIVIKHWKLHNTIRKDRFKPTLYQEEKSQLFEKENGAYTFNRYNSVMKIVSSDGLEQLEHHGNHMTTNCQPHDNQLSDNSATQYSIDKSSIDKSSLNLVKDNYKEKNTKKENLDYSGYNPNKNKLSTRIQNAIDYWNSKEVLPKCSHLITTLPQVGDVKVMFDVYRGDEIHNAIDNLSTAFEKIDPKFRPKSFNKFIINSLDNWLDSANPLEQYKEKEKIEIPLEDVAW